MPAGVEYTLTLQQANADYPLERAWLKVAGEQVDLRPQGPGLYVGSISIPNQLGTIQAEVGSRYAGEESLCTETWDLRPVVALQLNAPAEIAVGPSELTPWWYPFSGCQPGDPAVAAQDPNSLCEQCGDCSGASEFLTIAGTQMMPNQPVDGTIELTSPLPKGIQVHIMTGEDSTALRSGNPESIVLDPNTAVLPVATCGSNCPEAGTHTLGFAVRIPNAFEAAGTGQTLLGSASTIERTVQLTLNVEKSSWWTCWAWAIYTAVGTLLFLAFIWGFIRPLKFRQKEPNFPTMIRAVRVKNWLKKGPVEFTKAFDMDITDEASMAWWREGQTIWIDSEGLLQTDAEGAMLKIELCQEASGAVAKVTAVNGQRFRCGPHLKSARDWPNEPKFFLEPEVAVKLRLKHVYVPLLPNNKPDADSHCILFLQT